VDRAVQVKESAGAETKDRVYASAAEEFEVNGSKGKANLVLKFYKGAKKEATMVVDTVKGVTRNLTGALVDTAPFEAFFPAAGIVDGEHTCQGGGHG
jgi:hypothetical protein